MTRKNLALRSTAVLSAFLLASDLKAQNYDGLFKSGPADATKIVNAYFTPIFRGFGVGINSGWNTSAKTKSTLRFDIRFTATAAFVPTSDQMYDVKNLGLENIRPVNPNVSTGSTFLGNNQAGSEMRIFSNGTPTNQTFNLPAGIGVNTAITPTIQATVGLPKNIDVTLRYIPQINFGKDIGEIGMIGAGVKIEVVPLILGKSEKLIPFDLAIAAAYSSLNYKRDIQLGNQNSSDKYLDGEISGFNLEAIISKKFLVFTPFASVGYNTSQTKFKAIGSYEFDTPTLTNPNSKTTFVDPINIKQTDINGMKATAGFQLNIAFFRVYASYTAAKYNFANAGIGFGIGK